jgi:hypothetical protein
VASHFGRTTAGARKRTIADYLTALVRGDTPAIGVLSPIPGAPLRGFFFRAIRLKYVTAPLSALGSKFDGGRYNAAGAFEGEALFLVGWLLRVARSRSL